MVMILKPFFWRKQNLLSILTGCAVGVGIGIGAGIWKTEECPTTPEITTTTTKTTTTTTETTSSKATSTTKTTIKSTSSYSFQRIASHRNFCFY